MSNYLKEYRVKQRRIIAVKNALNTPRLPDDMQRFWNGVLTHLTENKTVKSKKQNKEKIMTSKTELFMTKLANSLEEIIYLLENIQRILKDDKEIGSNVTDLTDRNKQH